MQLPSKTSTTLPSVFLLLPSLIAAVSIDCGDIRIDRKPFNLKPLDGPHSLYRVKEHETNIKNTTFSLDICRPLEKTKGVPKDEDCPNNSRGKVIKFLGTLR